MKQEFTETKVINICDICLCRPSLNNQCMMCKKYLCEKCRVPDQRDFSDYPPLFCQKCWDIGTPYRKRENEAQEVCDVAFEDIWLEWKKEATKDLTDRRE